LNWLDLNNCYITDPGAEALAGSPVLAQLAHLNLSNNLLGIPGAQALFGSKYWGKVRTLALSGNHRIDTRAQQFLAQTLQGASDPALLRSMLQMQSRQEREYTNTHVRALAQKAGKQPAQAAAVLAEGLGDGRRKVRSAAAQMLAQMGADGSVALPRMVQRLFESSRLVHDQVAPALARLLPELRPEMQNWLCLIANPLLPAEANLRAALESERLPESIIAEMGAVAVRRWAWWDHITHKRTGPAPVPEAGRYPTDRVSVRDAVFGVLGVAEKHAGRHHRGNRKKDEEKIGRQKESAWFLARLTELIQGNLPKPVEGKKRAK
jgi:hypothetical protein